MPVRSIHAVRKDGKSAEEARKGRVVWCAALSRLLGLLCLEILVNSVEFGSACSQYECSTDRFVWYLRITELKFMTCIRLF
jgi:hypothetical protein